MALTRRFSHDGCASLARVRTGIDAGGTFTDLVDDRGRVVKVSSTPDDPTRAVRHALESAGLEHPSLLAHGTTVATNALIQRTGGTVALVTTRGFADVIEIARQTRPSLYDQHADRPQPLVPRALRLEVGGRLDAAGREIEPLDPATCRRSPMASTPSPCASCMRTSTRRTSGSSRRVCASRDST